VSRLAQLAQAPAPKRKATTGETCDLCAHPIPEEHRHLVDIEDRRLLCACRACTVLFDREGAGGGHFRLIPERRVLLDGFELPDELWDRLRIPVDLAFFFRSTPAGRMVAFYPGPMGAAESLLDLDDWAEVEAANPVVGELEDDVEALLANRANGAREYFLVPIDDCYRLVALIRTKWKGLGGGDEVWREIKGFFDELKEEAR
jgi:hypothetical protein